MLTVFDSLYKPQGNLININGIDELADAITRNIWTPNNFKDNYRKKDNFLKTCMVVLDCDDGLTILEAKELFAEYKHIIGTTKSHQIQKNGTVCDRFRIVLFLDSYCADKSKYEYNMKLLCKHFGMDSACAEASRCFHPCVKIVSINTQGKYFVLEEMPPKEYRKPPKKLSGPISSSIRTINQVLDGQKLVSDKGRHMNLIWVACRLHDLGWSTEQAISHMTGTYLFNTLESEDGHEEIRRQVTRAVEGVII